MKVKKNPNPEKKNPKRNSAIIQIATVLIIATGAILFFLWHQSNFNKLSHNDVRPNPLLGDEISVPEQSQPGIKSQDLIGIGDDDQSQAIPLKSQNIQPPPPSNPSKNKNFPHENDLKNHFRPEVSPLDGTTEELDKDQSSPVLANKCKSAALTIKQFYHHLDEEEYIKPFGLTPNSEVYFTSLIQTLLDNPPIVSGETNDLYTILQNTAHFFRIIGKNNIRLLKGILDREKDSFEDVLAQFYLLLHIPSCPQTSFNLQASDVSLYDYAGFFLNTMGGRLYLFRRDSMSRMVVSYYAILLIDEANNKASNKDGIDIKPAIDQLIDEIESTANTLRLKDMYLDKLYNLKEKYQ